MSQYVVHFTDDVATLGAILGTGCLKGSGPFGFGSYRKVPELVSGHRSVCFSEVPLDKLERLTRRHGPYGIGLTKNFVRRQAGARVWYVDQRSAQAASLHSLLRPLVKAKDFGHPIWDLTPFMDLLIPGTYEWDWEREWRVRGDLSFTLRDVAFVVTPDGFDELPALEGLHLHPKHDLVVAASTRPLEEYIEGLVQEFFQMFEDPVQILPVDRGEYVWTVPEWETEAAADEVLYAVQDEIRVKVVEYLNGISPSWVLSEDVASIYL